MIDCSALRDRMPEVAHGADAWTDAETAHLADCAGCLVEWRLVQQGRDLYADLHVDHGRVTAALLREVASDPEVAVIARLPWRAGAIGLLTAVAASILLLVYLPQRRIGTELALVADTATLGVLPELQGLNESELQSMLRSITPAPAGEITAGVVPNLDDLTDAELEQLLRSEGGE